MPCISGSNENNMSSKSPVIKFSPFEALFIGEKNKIVKRQPIKNSIFITKQNHRRKKISLRDLFDLGQNASNKENKDYRFRVPQRVTECLRNKKTNLTECNKKRKNNIVYYDFNGKKMVVKNNKLLKSKAKNAKVKSNKIKFKKKLDFINNNKGDHNTSDFSNKIVKKFPSETNRSRFSQIKRNKFSMSIVHKETKQKKRSKVNANRHLLRGKDGKFISKKEYLNVKLKDTSIENEYLPNNLKKNYVKEESRKKLCYGIKKTKLVNSTDNATDMCSISKQAKTTAKQALSMKLRDKYYQCYWPYTDLKFPKCPEPKTMVDLDDDENLLDLVYENFPIVRFESNQNFSTDFSDCLKDKCILPERNIKIYEKKKENLLGLNKLTVIFNNHIPRIKMKELKTVEPITLTRKKGIRSVIDEPRRPKNNHLINGKSFDCFLFQDVECKEIFLGNFLKPLWQNSWFGRLPKN